MLYLLDRKRKGNVTVLVTGGAKEAIFAYRNSMNVAIKNRKGFIKVIIKMKIDFKINKNYFIFCSRSQFKLGKLRIFNDES